MFKKRLPLIIAGVAFLLLQSVAMGTPVTPVTPVTPLPEDVELAYDDGDPDGGVLLTPGHIAATRISPPSGTWMLKTARYYLYQGEGKVRIFDDDADSPGADLIEGFTITHDGEPGWYDIDLQEYNIRVEGDFYMGIEGVDPMTPCSIGHDFLGGGNGRAWDYFPDFEWMPNPDFTYFIRAVVTDGVGIDEELIPQPAISSLCYPNPFSHSTAISYALPQAGRVTVSIWDASGRCLHTLIDANQAAGNYSIQWNGADNAGNHLPTGVYFAKINTNQSTLTQKVVLVR